MHLSWGTTGTIRALASVHPVRKGMWRVAKKAGGRLPGGGAAAVVSPAAEASVDGISLPNVVGVGASAGGLEAFTELLSHLPNDTGMAFVLIQHLDPKHESHLAE